jgi:hypothetical protein
MGIYPPSKSPFDARLTAATGCFGVWDTRHGCWAERPVHDRMQAEHMTVVMIDAYAAGFADALLRPVR